MTTALVLGLICATICPGIANASIVFDSGANPNTAYFADSGSSGQEIFDDFSIANGLPSNVQAAIWQGVYASQNTAPDDFTITIYGNNGTVPGAVISSQSVNVTRQQNGVLNLGGGTWDIYEYTADFSSVNLTNLDTYWISINNNTAEGWAWLADSTFGTIAYSPANSNNVFNTQSAMEFTLLSTPEPTSFVMFCACVIPLSSRRRRKLK